MIHFLGTFRLSGGTLMLASSPHPLGMGLKHSSDFLEPLEWQFCLVKILIKDRHLCGN